MISDELKDYVDYMIEVVDGTSNDWLSIRTWLINLMPNELRSQFSRRHNSIRKIILNQLDHDIIAYWEKQTGNRLFIDESKMTPKGYVSVSRSENMRRINELKKMNKIMGKKSNDH